MSINLYKKKTINNQPVLEEILSKSTDTVDGKPLVYDSTADNVKSTDDLNVNSVTASCFYGPLEGTAKNAICFNEKTYSEAYTDIRNGLATQACADAIQNCVDFIQSCVSVIEEKIPSQASASNQLADKDFVNSSITTNTANFRGTYSCIDELPSTGNTNNDYAFVCSLNTTTGNYIYDRYKWVASDSCWVCEYELNTTGFTAEQLASINSGITSGLVAKITDVYDNSVTVCMNGERKGSFSLNQNTDTTIDLGCSICNAEYATCATNATCASKVTTFNNYCTSPVSNNSDYNVGLLSGSPTSTTLASSAGCPLSFNPGTGVLKACCFCGCDAIFNNSVLVCGDFRVCGSAIISGLTSDCVATQCNNSNAEFYPAFVCRNNTSGQSGELLYTGSGLHYNPYAGLLKSVSICSTAGVIESNNTSTANYSYSNSLNSAAFRTLNNCVNGSTGNFYVPVLAQKTCGTSNWFSLGAVSGMPEWDITYNGSRIVCVCCNGSVTASVFCGCLNGNASTASGTSAYNGYCLDYYQGSADRQIILSDATTSSPTTTVAVLGRSTNCLLTFNPATGVMCRNNACMHGYGIMLPSAKGGLMYALIDAGSNNGNVIEGKIWSNAFAIAKTFSGDHIYRNSINNYGAPAAGYINITSTCFWLRYTDFVEPELLAKDPIKLVCTTTTAPNGITFTDSVSESACASSATLAHCACYLSACGNTTGPYVTVEHNNELNFYQAGAVAWLNYRGGTDTVNVGNGNGSLGTVCAANFYGNLCGTATCANIPLRIAYCCNYNFDVPLTNGVSTGYNNIYVSSVCRLRYFNTTGNLCITQSNGTTVAGTVTAANGCFSNACVADLDVASCFGFNGKLSNKCSSTSIGYNTYNNITGSLVLGYNASSDVCCGVVWTSTIDLYASAFGRHGKINVTIPSCNMTCDTYKGLRHIIANVINNGICNCTWTTSTIRNAPNARFSAFGYWWDDGGSADGTKRYSPGQSRHGAISSPAYIVTTASACSSLTICQMLYNCNYNICVGGVGEWNATGTNTWECGANLEIVF